MHEGFLALDHKLINYATGTLSAFFRDNLNSGVARSEIRVTATGTGMRDQSSQRTR